MSSILHDIRTLPYELVVKFSDFSDKLPNPNVWNSGFTQINNKFVFACRNEQSRYSDAYWGKTTDNLVRREVPVLVTLDENFKLETIATVNKSKNWTLSDVRLLNWKDELYAYGTFRNPKIQSCGKRLVDEFFAKVLGNNLIFLPFEHDFELRQKNWSNLISNDTLFWINFEQKGLRTENLMTLEKGRVKLLKKTLTKSFFRANHNAVDIGDYFVDVVHWHIKRTYVHYFLLRDKNFPFEIIKVSPPVRFNFNDKAHIEFWIGLVKYQDGFLISTGVQDADSYLVFVKETDLFDLFI